MNKAAGSDLSVANIYKLFGGNSLETVQCSPRSPLSWLVYRWSCARNGQPCLYIPDSDILILKTTPFVLAVFISCVHIALLSIIGLVECSTKDNAQSVLYLYRLVVSFFTLLEFHVLHKKKPLSTACSSKHASGT